MSQLSAMKMFAMLRHRNNLPCHETHSQSISTNVSLLPLYRRYVISVIVNFFIFPFPLSLSNG
ncbi:hypothetical protein CW304_13455 [Bacillus sp. UFRGS-B20]|nr:hypothetical protein CW304_13455 [Bacillus sp. UFRGS-B20]